MYSDGGEFPACFPSLRTMKTLGHDQVCSRKEATQWQRDRKERVNSLERRINYRCGSYTQDISYPQGGHGDLLFGKKVGPWLGIECVCWEARKCTIKLSFCSRASKALK